MKKLNKIVLVGPGKNHIGGISECIQRLVESNLNTDFELFHFETDVIIEGKLFAKLKKKIITLFYFVRLMSCRYEICHIHSSSYLGFYERVLYAFICKISRTKVIFQLHGGEYIKFYNKSRLRWFIRLFLHSLDHVIYVDKNFSSTFSNRNSTYIPNMVEIPKRLVINKVNEEHAFLSVSVLEKRKNVDQIILACNKLRKKNLSFKFYICGYGPQEQYLKDLVYDLGLSEFVFFLGPVVGESKHDVFNRANTFILSSNSESFGIVLIEALSFGLNVISTPVGIAPAIHSSLDNVELYPINDIEALSNLMENKVNLHKKNSRPNLSSVEFCRRNYSVDAVIDLYRGVYQEVL